MKNSSLIILSVLVVLLAVLSTLDTEQGQDCSRSHRTYSYHPVPNAWGGNGDETLSVPRKDETDCTVAPLTEANITVECFPALPAEGSPLSAPPALLETSAMAELTPVQLPPLDAGMVNVTGVANDELRMKDEESEGENQRVAGGYRIAVPVAGSEYRIALPYDPSLLPQGFTEEDIQTYVYDRQHHRWAAIQRDSVNEAELLVCSRFRPWKKGLPRTRNDMVNPQDALSLAQDMVSFASQGDGGGDSPLDFINAVLKTPEMPETSAYTPTSIKELKAADPLEGLTLMQPPTANNSGTANLSYPIEIPAGRQGMQPNLALTYSSGGGNGWLGVGWDISIPSITVETRWGVPRYDQQKESEVYVYEGEQLVTYDNTAGRFREMPHRTNQWTDRIVLDQDGYEQFYPRKNEAFDSIVRHGGGPGDYWWTVTHRNGVTDYYGKYASNAGVNNSCVLRKTVNPTANDTGPIAHWALAESVDPDGNSVRYYYDIAFSRGGNGRNWGKQIYIDSISYTCRTTPSQAQDEDGKYSVVFHRRCDDRTDVVTSLNRGFKEVTADVLCWVDVSLMDTSIRQYAFFTENSRRSEYKTRLTDIVRIDALYRNSKRCMGDLSSFSVSVPDTAAVPYYFDIGPDSPPYTVTHLDYFDSPSGDSLFGSPVDIVFSAQQTDSIRAGFVTAAFGSEGKSTALGATKGKSWSAGGTATVGAGPVVPITSLSAGGNFNYSRSRTEGILTLIDLDGDGLADKVFKKNGRVWYRSQVADSTDAAGNYFFHYGPKVPVEDMSDFLKETGSTTSWGLQASAFLAYSGSWPTTRSTTSVYFSDVNADGLPDLVTDDGVKFNMTGHGENVSFKDFYDIVAENRSSGTDVDSNYVVTSSDVCAGSIFDGEVKDSIACAVDWVFSEGRSFKYPDTASYLSVVAWADSLEATGEYRCTDQYGGDYHIFPESSEDQKIKAYRRVVRCGPFCSTASVQFPLSMEGDPDLEAVKVWVAPMNGKVTIHSEIRLLEDSSESRRQSKWCDGVSYAVQVSRGVGLGTSPPSLTDTSSRVVLSGSIGPSYYVPILQQKNVTVSEGDIVLFRLRSGENRDFDEVEWHQTITYQEYDPADGIYPNSSQKHDRHGVNKFYYDAHRDYVVSGKQYFMAERPSLEMPGGMVFTPHFKVSVGVRTGGVYRNSLVSSGLKLRMTVARNGSGDANYNLDIADNMDLAWAPSVSSFSAPVSDSCKVTFRVTGRDRVDWSGISVSPHITYIFPDTVRNGNGTLTLVWDTLHYYPPVEMDIDPKDNLTSLEEACQRLFGPLYRGWGQFAYNNNDTMGGTAHTDSVLPLHRLVLDDYVFPGSRSAARSARDRINGFKDHIVRDSTHTQESGTMTENFSQHGIYNPLALETGWVEMRPDSRYQAWVGYGNINHITAAVTANTRMPEYSSDTNTADIGTYDHPVPVVDGHQVKTVRKQNFSRMKNHSLSLSVPWVPISVGLSISNGTNTVLTDYMDLNGDRYPDVVGQSYVQYSTPWGGIGPVVEMGPLSSGITCSSTRSGGANFGGSYQIPTRGASNNPKNSKISFDGSGNAGADLGGGTDLTDFTWMDVNGDGLPDKVSRTDTCNWVSLNSGYGFLGAERWQMGGVRNGSSRNFGMNMGGSFNVGQASIGGGIGVNLSRNRTDTLLSDLNGDGLPDLVERTGGFLRVSYGLGDGSWSPTENLQGLSEISFGRSYSESANVSVTLGFTFFSVLKVCAGISGSPYNKSFSKDSVQLADIDGDGRPDYVTSSSEDRMTVRYNRSGKTNLLRKVTNFTGSAIELDYTLQPASYEKPQRSWNLSRVETWNNVDSCPVGGNRTLTVFSYGAPNHNRAERMDYGYGTVTTRQYDTGGGDSLYRITVENYENRMFSRRGHKLRDCVCGHDGRVFVENLYEVLMADLNHPDSIVYGDCPAMLYKMRETEIHNFYEGRPVPGMTTAVQRDYDTRRNVTRYVWLGDTTRTDEYFRADISYRPSPGRNLVSLADSISVFDFGGNLLQRRTGIYDSLGHLLTLVGHNTNGAGNARYDLSRDIYGNVVRITLPQNTAGQRMWYAYTYDTLVRSYPVMVESALGYRSSAVYDYHFGKPVKTTDINGNEIWYRYDLLGRMTRVTAPYEQGNQDPYTIRMEYHPHHYGAIDVSTNAQNPYSYAVTRHYDPQHPGNDIRTTVISDGLGRMLQTKKDAEIGGQEVSLVTGKVVYDCFGRTVAQYHPFTEDTVQYALYNDSVTAGTATVTEYDILDRQTRVTLPLNSIETTFRYGFGNFLGSSRFLTEVTDPNGNISSTLAGGMRQKLRQMAPDSSVTLFEYDCLGQLVGCTDPDGLVTTYQYDLLGRMTHRNHPDAGVDIYKYDPAGNVTHHKNGNGREANHTYYYNLLTGISYLGDTANNIRYIYGGPGASRNAAGRVLLLEDASGWQAFSYGALGEITETVHAFVLPNGTVPHTFALGYRYDSWNRLQSIDYPDGEIVSYGYNAGGLLRNVSGLKNGNRHSYIDSICYNRFELKECVLYGNGAHTEYNYDLLMRLSHLYSENGLGEPMQNIDYDYDDVGNIIDIANNAGMLSNGLGGEYYNHYDYDRQYRLMHSEGWWGNADHSFIVDMEYSGNGRILRKSLSADVLRHNAGWDMVEYDNIYRYTTGCNRLREVLEASDTDRRQAFEWDRGGNMIVHDGVHDQCSRRYCWDSENRLASFSDCHNAGYYQYDAGGERTYKLTGEMVLQNIGGQWHSLLILDNPTLYASPYLVFTPQGYTKHYYAENERIASRIGSGNLSDFQTIPHIMEMPAEESEEPLNPDDPEGVPVPDWPAEPEEPENQLAPPFGLDWNFDGNMSELFEQKQSCSQTQMGKVLSCAGATFDIADDRLGIEGWASLQNPDEPDCYWYHPDHLGSSSWITHTDSTAVQHLHYLPWGEDYVDQRTTNWSALHTFSAKERDTETGLTYFGARYYSSNLSIWLSVDPMSDKYPSLSPYVYCADNPVKLTDPDGRWIPGVDDDNNIIVTQEEGDDINSFKKFMGTAYSDEEIQNMYNGSTENGIINLTKTYGREFQIMTDALNDAYNNPDFENCKNYNCWGMAIAVTKCIQVQGNGPDDCWGISFNLNDFEHFDNSLSMGYVQGGCESASVGKTVVRFGRNESDHPHGAVYMGTDRSGTEYVFTKNGWTVRPELSTTETMLFENGYGGNCDRSGRAGQGYYTRTIKSRKRNR